MYRRSLCFVLSLCALVLGAALVAAGERPTPVDTVELALTQRGQSASRVQESLGTPVQVIPLPTEYRIERDRAGATAIAVQREVWISRGNNQVGD